MARGCGVCKATGYSKCTNCDGTNQECETCGGDGLDRNTPCSACGGTRLYTIASEFDGDAPDVD